MSDLRWQSSDALESVLLRTWWKHDDRALVVYVVPRRTVVCGSSPRLLSEDPRTENPSQLVAKLSSHLQAPA